MERGRRPTDGDMDGGGGPVVRLVYRGDDGVGRAGSDYPEADMRCHEAG